MTAQTGFQIVPDYRKAITKATLNEATVLSDINAGFPTSWIKECLSVEIKRGNTAGDTLSVLGQNPTITVQQNALLSAAALNDELFFKIDYLPYENIEGNGPRTIEFSFKVIPDTQASYPGGWDAADNYLMAQGITVISRQLDNLRLWSKFGFKIDTDGSVQSVEVEKSTGDLLFDLQITEILKGMPSWQPAIDHQGQKAPQKYYLMVGMAGC